MNSSVRWLIFGGGLAIAWPGMSESAAAESAGQTSSEKTPVLNWETGENKSYLVPAIEIPGFLAALNLFNRTFLDHATYATTANSTWHNLKTVSLDYDDDPFNVNQFGHPTEGAILFGIARSSGLNFWQSLVASNVGSFTWEVAGETESASFNDLVTTGQAGSLFGESLFRLASLVLEKGGRHPTVWHEVSAAVLMPPLGFNRLVLGERFRTVFPSHNPPLFWQARFGYSQDDRARDNKAAGAVMRQEAVVDFNIEYGLPGRPGYTYTRPFDYFQLSVGAMTSSHTHNWLDHLLVRGLLWGRQYDSGANYDGVWGLYGTYEFASPQIFRVSNTAAALGTTFQWWMSPKLALQGTVLGGVGFGGAGTNPIRGLRDYHIGVTPEGLADLRFVFNERAMLELTGRLYYISGTGTDDQLGTETIARGRAGIVVRVHGRHALGLEYVASHRLSFYNNAPSTHQSVGTFSLTYSFLSDERFGVVGKHRF